MSLRWTSKTPAEVVYRSIPWSGPLEDDTILTQALVVLSGSATLSNITLDDTTVTATVSGGLADEVTVIQSTITTADGRTLQQIATIEVLDPVLIDIPTAPSSTTKRAVVEMAAEALSLAGYEFDQTPEEQSAWLRRLDGLMAQWASVGLDLGYNQPAIFGQGDLDDVYGAADGTILPVSWELAVIISPGIAKSMSAEAMASHARAMDDLRAAYTVIPQRRIGRNTPIGAGYKSSVWAPFGGLRRGFL